MKKTLVFGASLKPNRYSNLAIKRLVDNNVSTEAFGEKEGEAFGVQIKTNLQEFQNIHTITLYMNPKTQKDFYKTIVELAPKRVIFNPGTENIDFYKVLRNNNIEVLEACTLVLLATNQY
ncbi:hypothetical protein GGR42_001076 [Saonia flava]|uniref:CoA-binding domain-containing protein n=1 Tax=Saonia flava TaxID=523696 RepID=A0A846QZR0_9FLAO|nr:CoA-binding protein [Saonia flava]NJB70614.1 hypothetical protein [Saonia flava]